MQNYTVTNTQKINLKISPVTLAGKPAPVDGVPVWSVIDGKCTIAPAKDGISCFVITADDDAGLSHVKVNADADLGAGVVDISDSAEITVTGEQAAALGLAADAPVPK